ncbi:hypothetical protein POMI540_3467 [Schizosaccharomyces pombe]|uniref:Uncharacterized protein C651.04 n=1 Tax=Schizosaccharomyces pombe (strain 972 / ATCC 24843) TaxID=284812 RepID=YBW4_SCHPO|nr:uncharacterized protein SPBC651.04 [Schizosaccharomyces pombe]O94662.1 RecName: Full=Uncharacterized protein C651.04 [Schizosaccharomyces pombe 972h-]CAB37600.1 sequence orphan [Schizosaccharomyces pombe]|eukprot:NP_595502.1 uncharacterized protein SPBC651.04 [Schizosaccharomyces pombe]
MSSAELGKLHIYASPEQWEKWSPRWKSIVFRTQYESIFKNPKHHGEKKPFHCLFKLAGTMKSISLSHLDIPEHRMSNAVAFPITTSTTPMQLDVTLQFRGHKIPLVVGEASVSLEDIFTHGTVESVIPLFMKKRHPEAYLRIKLVYTRSKRKSARKHKVPSSFHRFSGRRGLGIHYNHSGSQSSLITLPLPQKQPDFLRMNNDTNELKTNGFEPIRFVFTTTPYSPASFEVPKTLKT